jgi:uncharacterized protein YprB with RNaseH-like and TPR domain
MLANTFCHIYGVGTVTEQRIWHAGLIDWKTFLAQADSDSLPHWVKNEFVDEIKRSEKELKVKNHHYFRDHLSHREHWRTFPEFRDTTVYLDIETTGLDQFHHDITVVGLFDGEVVETYIQGKNLEKLTVALKKYTTIVTFNGILFDLPFIATKFPGIELDHIQLDLRFILKRIGYSGGLKNIEKQLGITRDDETADLRGNDAVRLWKNYQRGNEEALELLVRYNTEDIVNLERLMEFAYKRMKKRIYTDYL